MSSEETKQVADEFDEKFRAYDKTITDTFIEASILMSAIDADDIHAQYEKVHDKFVEMMDLIDCGADLLSFTMMELSVVNDPSFEDSETQPQTTEMKPL